MPCWTTCARAWHAPAGPTRSPAPAGSTAPTARTCATSWSTGATASTGGRRRRSSTPSTSSGSSSAAVDLHFIHQPGVGPDPMPLLLAHGWPGSVWEFNELIPRLTDPARFGGDPADAFTVVAPSLPGYTLSYRAGPAALRRGRDVGPLRRADDRRARLPALRGPGRRLGRLRRGRARRAAPREDDRHPPQLPADPRGHPVPGRVVREGAHLPGRARALAEGGDGLPRDPGHEAADAGLRAHRLPRRPGRLDHREVPDLERPPRRVRGAGSTATRCSRTSCSTG